MKKSIRLIALLAVVAGLLIVPAIPASAAQAACLSDPAGGSCVPAGANCTAGTVGFAINTTGVGSVTASCGGVPFAVATDGINAVKTGKKANNGVFTCTDAGGGFGSCGTGVPQTPPNFAASAFVAEATVTPGLCYPTQCPPVVGASWTLDLNTNPLAAGQPRGPALSYRYSPLNVAVGFVGGAVGGAGTTVTSGLVPGGPFCGNSVGGGGAGTITNDAFVLGSPDSVSVTGVGWLQSAGSLIVATGTVTSGNGGVLVAVVSAVPNPLVPNNSCTTGATKFIVAGTAVAVWAP